jgi:hypothetical protein
MTRPPRWQEDLADLDHAASTAGGESRMGAVAGEPEGIELTTDWKSEEPLFEDEEGDVRAEARRVLGPEDGDQWLHEPNSCFGGRTPDEVIDAGRGFWVRDVLRSYLYIGSS